MEKPLHRYTQEYYDLCKKAHVNVLRIPFDTKRKALNFRIEMYLFRKALLFESGYDVLYVHNTLSNG